MCGFILDIHHSINWVVISSTWFMNFQFPSRSVIIHSLLHLKTVRICVPCFLIIQIFKLVDYHHLLTIDSNLNWFDMILDLDNLRSHNVVSFVKPQLGIDISSIKMKDRNHITNIDLFGFHIGILLRMIVGD